MYRSFRSEQKRRTLDRKSTTEFINISSDGSTLFFSQPGINCFGDPSLVESVINSRKVIGKYSEDSERNFVNDTTYLHFLLTKYLPDDETKEKVVDLDLNISEALYKDYTSTGNKDLDNFLKWIINNKEAFDKEFGLLPLSEDGGKFAMHKNILTNLLVPPYWLKNECNYYAYSFNGVIYIRKEYNDIINGKISHLGHRFEQLMTEEDAGKDVICNEEFRAVIINDLGPHKLLVSAALDCANPEDFDDDFKDLSSFITLKTLYNDIEGSYYYRYHMLLWYLNYVFFGVPKTLLGQRSRSGVVKLLKLIDVNEMLRLGKESWNPGNCLFFASEALSFIKKKVESEPGSVFYIRKEAGRPQITCTKDPEYEQFLPEWFRQEILETDKSDYESNVVLKDEK